MARNGGGKGKYALDAGSLLDGILSETQSEAQREEERIKAELQAKESEAEQRRAKEAEHRRSQAQAALAAERDRQDRARARRDLVLQTMADLEAEQEAGSLTASGAHAAVAGPPMTGEYASAIGYSQSYSHIAVRKRPKWVVPVALAATILIVGAGVTAGVIVFGAPSIDPTSYPKSALDLGAQARNPLETIGFNYVPQPEPVHPVLDETATASAGEEDRPRERSRDRDRDRDEESANDASAPLDLDLDGSGIFDRGSE